MITLCIRTPYLLIAWRHGSQDIYSHSDNLVSFCIYWCPGSFRCIHQNLPKFVEQKNVLAHTLVQLGARTSTVSSIILSYSVPTEGPALLVVIGWQYSIADGADQWSRLYMKQTNELIHTGFVSCQSDHPFLMHGHNIMQPWNFRVKVTVDLKENIISAFNDHGDCQSDINRQ